MHRSGPLDHTHQMVPWGLISTHIDHYIEIPHIDAHGGLSCVLPLSTTIFLKHTSYTLVLTEHREFLSALRIFTVCLPEYFTSMDLSWYYCGPCHTIDSIFTLIYEGNRAVSRILHSIWRFTLVLILTTYRVLRPNYTTNISLLLRLFTRH